MQNENIVCDLENFKKINNKKWELGNKILYDMCKNHIKHTKDDEVRAKLWLIGRSYAVAIERRNKNSEKSDGKDIDNVKFYDMAVNEMIKFEKTNHFDEKISALQNKEFNEESIKDVLILHSELTNLFNTLTGQDKRSLASKYLHFHCPIFPIYDSIAKRNLNKMIKAKIILHDLSVDKEYDKFCQQILLLKNYIKEKTGREEITSRELDTFLLQTKPKDEK